MFIIALAESYDYCYDCNICGISCYRYYLIKLSAHSVVLCLCLYCYDTKWHNFYTGCQRHEVFPARITDKKILLVPINETWRCESCLLLEMPVSKLIISSIHCEYYYVCHLCMCNFIEKVLHKINCRNHTRELYETVDLYIGHAEHQKYFDYLNEEEKNKIMCERSLIKKTIDLPNVLSNIVLSYHWIFEQ
jgi:hypothetical protein